jgi:DNA-directed RNA polymerase specialized sigma24 family protein
MANQSVPDKGKKTDWVLSQDSFNRFLQWLDAGVDSGGLRYLELRQRLVLYFDRKNCTSPDELADETLNRVARRLEEEGSISTDTPAHYCFIVARFVLLEFLRTRDRLKTLDDRLPAPSHSTQEKIDSERRAECLERCMRNLDPDEIELITGYYQGTQRVKIENRKALAARLGITMNALSIRACRIRDKLETCLRKILSEPK